VKGPKPSLALLFLFALTLPFLATRSEASYQFQFSGTQDYAVETAYWGVAEFKTLITNTGDGDSIRFNLTMDNPGWFAQLCIGPKCYFPPVTVYFNAGQSDTAFIEVYVDDVSGMGIATLTGTMKSAPAETHSETYGTWNQLPSILIVDDDGGQSYQTYLAAALSNAGYPGRLYDTNTLGRPSQVMLDSHWMVFWTTAGGSCSYFTAADESHLAGFLDGGGNLFLASSQFLSSRSVASSFVTDYLHISSWTSDTGGSPVTGVVGDPITAGMSLDLSGGPVSYSVSDAFVDVSPAGAIFYRGSEIKGLKVEEGNHKAVFLAFPFEDVSTAAPDPNNQDQLIANVMEWFEPPVAGVPAVVDRGGSGGSGAGIVAFSVVSANPFKGDVTLALGLSGGAKFGEVAVYDIQGRVVRTLLRGALASGDTRLTWDGTDDLGASVASGIYYVRAQAGRSLKTCKLICMR